MKKLLLRVSGTLLITGLCTAYIVWKINIVQTVHLLTHADFTYFFGAVAIMILSVWPMAWRWQQLLFARQIRDRLSWLVRAYFVAYAAAMAFGFLESALEEVRSGQTKTFNDFDVAVYVKKDDAPIAEAELLAWMADRLREAYRRLIDPSQIEVGVHCVTIMFKGSGTKVDVVPVLYEGDTNDCGYLIAKDTGDRLLTSVRLHLDFVRVPMGASDFTVGGQPYSYDDQPPGPGMSVHPRGCEHGRMRWVGRTGVAHRD